MPDWGFFLNTLNLRIGTHTLTYAYGRRNITMIVQKIQVYLLKQPYGLKTGSEIKKDSLDPTKRSPVQAETEMRQGLIHLVVKEELKKRMLGTINYQICPKCFIFWAIGLTISLSRKRKWECVWGRRVWMGKVRSIHLFIQYINLIHILGIEDVAINSTKLPNLWGVFLKGIMGY